MYDYNNKNNEKQRLKSKKQIIMESDLTLPCYNYIQERSCLQMSAFKRQLRRPRVPLSHNKLGFCDNTSYVKKTEVICSGSPGGACGDIPGGLPLLHHMSECQHLSSLCPALHTAQHNHCNLLSKDTSLPYFQNTQNSKIQIQRMDK